MFRSNLHTHSTFSDGKGTMEDNVLAALDRGFVSLGFSDHAPSVYEKSFALPEGKVGAYRGEFIRLRDKYRGQIELYLGVELDILSPFDPAGLDYFIGSAHYIQDGDGVTHCIDYMPETLETAIQKSGGGNPRRFVRLYFDNLIEMTEKRKPDVIGHVDIFTKFNDGNRFFDEDAKWYLTACAEAAEGLAATGTIIEVNTALAAKIPGKNRPYPSPHFLACLQRAGAPVTISSDAHRPENLSFWFEEAENLLREVGYSSVKMLRGGRFVDMPL